MSMFLFLVVIKMNKIFNVVMWSNILNILENKNLEISYIYNILASDNELLSVN